MQAALVLQQKLSPSLESVHKKRRDALFKVVESLLRCHRLMPTFLGRALRSQGRVKSRIKQVDRLLSNWRLHVELPSFFSALCQAILAGRKKCVVLVDWTDLESGHEALVAAIPFAGRALPVYIQVHRQPLRGRSKLEAQFIRGLYEIFPKQMHAIVVTDRGFKNPWFKEVSRVGWDYIGRCSAGTLMAAPKATGEVPKSRADWQRADAIWDGAGRAPQFIGEYYTARANPLRSRIVLYRKKAKGRKISRRPNRRGVHAGSDGQKKSRRRHRQPWMLCTSLREEPQAVVNIYKRRMQIEETFRDTKNHRFGWAFEDVRSKSADKLRAILLVAALGTFIVSLIGHSIEKLDRHRDYQSNTIKTRRVLSLFYLAKLYLQDHSPPELPHSWFEGALADLARQNETTAR